MLVGLHCVCMCVCVLISILYLVRPYSVSGETLFSYFPLAFKIMYLLVYLTYLSHAVQSLNYFYKINVTWGVVIEISVWLTQWSAITEQIFLIPKTESPLVFAKELCISEQVSNWLNFYQLFI